MWESVSVGRIVLSIAGLLLLFGGPSTAQTINFDDASDGEVINNNYAGQGVTFTCINCNKEPASEDDSERPSGSNNTDVVARVAQDFTPPSAPNVVTTWDEAFGDGCFAEEEEGIVRANFSQVVSSVSVRVITDDDVDGDGDVGYLRAYDSDDVMVDEDVSSTLIGVGSDEVISVSGDISYVEFAGLGDDDTCFDDLSFGAGVPTMPNSWQLALIGILLLIGFYVIRRRFSTTWLRT